MEEILAIILKDTFSSAQFKKRVRVLKSNLLKSFFASSEAPVLSEAEGEWLKSLPPDFLQKFNKDNVYQIFSDLEKLSAGLKVLTVYLVFEPDLVSLKQIGSFARTNFNSPSLLLDIKIDPALIAGTALSWKGVYRDFSLRAKLEEEKAEIAEGFKRFLR